MKRVIVMVVLLGLTAQAGADNKKIWKGVFAGSLTLMIGGGASYWYGGTEIDESRKALCDGGAYSHIDSSCPMSGPLTPAQVDALNEQGNRGKTFAYAGAGVFVVGGGLAAFSFYKAFVEQDKEEPKVVVAPTLTRGGAGAALSLRW